MAEHNLHSLFPSGVSELNRLELRLSLQVRRCAEQDLPNLEWFGLFTHDKDVIQATYEQQMVGKHEMLLAVLGNFPVGQVWVQLPQRSPHCAGYLWALRVFPILQGCGIGTRLIHDGEQRLRVHGAALAEIAVDKTNRRARHLYERLGYRRVCGTGLRHAKTDTTPSVVPSAQQWLLRKVL